MEEWKEYQIADICKIKHGFAFKGQYFTDCKQPYVCITPGNFAIKGGFKLNKPKYYNGPIPENYILHANDLIITMTDLSKEGDTLGYSALVPQSSDYIFLHNQRIGLVEEINDKIDKHFLYWIMRTYDYQKYIVKHCSGSTVKHTSPNNIGSYFFKAPSLKKQKDIASILDNFEAKIELNRRINANLEAQAQALFRSWFVDFEPFRDGPFVDSELGKIPQGWKVGTFQDIINITSGKRPPLKVDKCTSEAYIPVYGASSIQAYTTSFLRNEDLLLIGRVGTLGIVQKVTGLSWPSDNTLIITSPFYEYSYQILKTIDFNKLNRGSTQPLITQTDIKNQIILLPSNEVLYRYEKISANMFSLNKKNNSEIKTLSALRDTLLPKLMAGEIKI